jgi:hydroxymethylbilane synthase
MPDGSSVGTSSLRRAAQIAERHPRLEARLLRGNVETRLAKLDRGEYDAVILAAAGLIRLGLEARIASRLALEESLPAPGQGALGIECVEARAEVAQIVRSLNQEAAARCVRAERAVSRALGGSCSLPLGAYAEPKGAALLLRGLVASADGRRVLRAQAEGADPEALGAAVASDLRRQGADEILKAS